jgi:hypothetical protein
LLSLFAALAASGFFVPSQGADDGSRYAAIWEKRPGPAYVARHGMISDGYQQEFDKRSKEGFRLMPVNGY